MVKTAIITGVTGQMGSYLTELLLNKGIKVIGAVRRLSIPNKDNIKHIHSPNFTLEAMDLGDSHSINFIIEKYKPDYFFNCAANSFVGTSWQMPEQHFEYNTLGVLRQLEAIRKYSPHTRYLNFGSSEEFGDVIKVPQDESHPPRARSPYGASKASSRQIVKVYRESYHLYALQCWCFNYESPRRGEEFVTRKITKGVSKIYNQIRSGINVIPFELGNVESQRDWSHAADFAEGVWRMMNQDEFNEKMKEFIKFNDLTRSPSYTQKWLSKNIQEYVFSSGQTHSISEFIEKAFNLVGIKGCWINGQPIGEEHDPKKNVFAQKQENGAYPILVEINPKFYRPAEVNLLLGCSDLAKKELGWEPKISFETLIKEMLQRDLSDYNISLDSIPQLV